MPNLLCPSIDTSFLSPNGFLLSIERLPKVSFFSQSVELPTVELPPLAQETPYSLVEVPSEKMRFSPLNLNFIVDEKMENYLEVFKWMQGLGFPESNQQYVDQQGTRYGDLSELAKNYSDAKLIVLGSNNVPIKTFNFVDCFPTSLGGITFSSTNQDVQYVTVSLTLEYTYFTIE